ncbi:MAG: hypothetical protein EBS84_18110 [Proteobacteria bacterium]|nr:hypothetical protein [Pseudomonadota bacterium]
MITADQPIYQTRPCAECKTPFDAPGAFVCERFIAWQHFCTTCLPAVRENQERERADLARRQREGKWLEICPAEFVTIDRRLLPDPSLFDRVQAWSYSPRGMVVAGETGMAKTRSCWALLHREFMAGRSVRALNAYDLARWPAMVMSEPARADALLKRIVSADIFYADDPFKSRLSATVEELLFVALDERTSRKLPCFFSFNDSAATILERLSTDRAKAFLRRIRDFADVVKPTPATAK